MSDLEQKEIRESSIVLHKLPPLTTKKPIQTLPINSPIRTRNALHHGIMSPLTSREIIEENTTNEISTYENSKIKQINNNTTTNAITKSPSTEVLKIKRFNSPIRTKKPINTNSDRFAPKVSKVITNNNKKVRTDRNGTEINHKNKKLVKVTFIDQIDSVPFTDIVEIESVKKYNYVMGLPEQDLYVRDTCCRGCSII